MPVSQAVEAAHRGNLLWSAGTAGQVHIVDEVKLRFYWGRELARVGRAEESPCQIEEAMAVFQRLGTKPYIACTEQALAALL